MLIYILFYFMFYFTLGTGILYFSQFFSAIGMSGEQSGTVFAAGSFLAMGFQPFMGYINDRTQRTKELLMLMILLAFGSLTLMNYTTSFPQVLCLYVLYAIAVFCEMPLMDTLSLSTEYPFGKIRLWGSIGFAVGGLAAGKVVALFGSAAFLYLGMIAAIVTALIIMRIPRTKGTIERSEEKVDLRNLLTNKKYLIFVAVAMLFLGTNNGHNSYFGVYFEGIGGSMTLLGVTIFLMTLSEVPLIGFSTRLVGKKGAEFVVTLSLLMVGLRWGLYYLLPEPSMVAGSFMFQGASVGLFFGAANLFVREIVNRNTLGTAIMVFMAAGSLGGVFVQYASGVIIERSSPVDIYALYTLLAAIGLILMLINKRMKKG